MFDTSVFPPYRKQIDKFIPVSKFSLVVFYELAATNIDDSAIQKLEMWKTTLSKVNGLVTPSQTDWLIAAKAVRRLRKLKLIDKKMSATVLQNDALIARSAYTHNCFVVTENVKDFTLLQKVMPKLEVIPAADFFG